MIIFQARLGLNERREENNTDVNVSAKIVSALTDPHVSDLMPDFKQHSKK